jgi:anti-anti-sigma factor
MTSSSGPFPAFDIDASVVGDQTILAVRGDIDSHAAPELAAYLDAVIARDNLDIVLDLAQLESLDAAGLSVIAGATIRLRLSGGSLTIRTPSAFVSDLLDVTGLAKMISDEDTPSPLAPLGPEQVGARIGLADPVRNDEIAGFLSMVSSIPANDEVVDGALRLVVTLATATVGGADGVSVSLRRHGHLATVAASDQTITEMDAGQYATGQGPCLDASVTGHWFHAESLDDEVRWPDFVPKARALGIKSILSTPLTAGDVPVGALNIYSRTASAFAPEGQQLASTFAAEASAILADAGLEGVDDELSKGLGEMLRTREIISQAQGVLMERHGIGENDAYTALRRISVAQTSPLSQAARETVMSTPHGRPIPGDRRRESHDG